MANKAKEVRFQKGLLLLLLLLIAALLTVMALCAVMLWRETATLGEKTAPNRGAAAGLAFPAREWTEEARAAIAAANAPEPEPEPEPQIAGAPDLPGPAYRFRIDDAVPGELVDGAELNPENLSAYFAVYEIAEGDAVYNRIIGKSFPGGSMKISLSDIRYLKLIHYNFDHELQVGELIVNTQLAEEFCEIFLELYEAGYEIQSMYLIDNYWTGDGATSDTASIEENNTSAFCYRSATNSYTLSNHAYGCAIDINSQQNPSVTYRGGKAYWYHENASDFIDRDSGLPHVITHEDICFKIFTAHGFEWGGDWDNPKDYQHFEKPLYER